MSSVAVPATATASEAAIATGPEAATATAPEAVTSTSEGVVVAATSTAPEAATTSEDVVPYPDYVNPYQLTYEVATTVRVPSGNKYWEGKIREVEIADAQESVYTVQYLVEGGGGDVETGIPHRQLIGKPNP